MQRAPTLFGRARRDDRGVAAVEAALVFPVIVVLLVVGFDLYRYATFSRKIQNVATTLGELVSRDDDGAITQTDLDTVFNSEPVIFPEAMTVAKQRGTSVWAEIQSTLSSVVFKTSAGCSAGSSDCVYKAYVSWTSGVGRPCSTALQAAADTAKPSPTTLPASVFGTESLLVADVTFNFRPTFLSSIVGSSTIARSYYVDPRYAKEITLSASGKSSSTVICTVP